MKKGTKAKKPVPKEQQKISSFFKKLPQNEARRADSERLIDITNTADDTSSASPDIIPGTPFDLNATKKRKRNETAVEDVTVVPGTPVDLNLTKKLKNSLMITKNLFKNAPLAGGDGAADETAVSPRRSMRIAQQESGVTEFTFEAPAKSPQASTSAFTPRKSPRLRSKSPRKTPKKTPGSDSKRQKSILQYLSPKQSPNGSSVKSGPYKWEVTPTKTEPKVSSPVADKVKTKLEFKEEPAVELDLNDSWDDDITLQIDDDSLNLQEWQYCTVTNVCSDTKGNPILYLKSKNSEDKSRCKLKGVWRNLKIKSGDTVNVVAATANGDVPYIVNNDSGMLVYEPDNLISGTSVVGFLFCKRKGVLSERFRSFDSDSKVMAVGTLVHELFQRVLRDKISGKKEIERVVEEMLSKRDLMYKLYSNNMTLDEAKSELRPFIPKIVQFVEAYIDRKTPKIKFNETRNKQWDGRISSIEDIEENIWSPELGMKGRIDVTVATSPDRKILPVELKTGRASMSLEHKGQVVLYTMMMSQLGPSVASGLLLYLREGLIHEISSKPAEKRDLVMLRNELAYYLTRTVTYEESDSIRFPELPEPINHPRACEKCPYSVLCTAYLSKENHDLPDSHPLKTISLDTLQHLTPEHVDYFVKWTSLIALEEINKKSKKNVWDIWRLPPEKREKCGKSLCNMKLVDPITEEDGLYIHKFTKISGDDIDTDIVEGNYIVISSDTRPAVASGFAVGIEKTSVTISLDRNITSRHSYSTFHLDTYDSSMSLSFNMSCLGAILDPTDRAARLRELVVEKVAPQFSKKIPRCEQSVLSEMLGKLNKPQKRAVLTVLTARDYVLIKGMPGTGKTATIVALIQLLVKLNQTVLITSHTHSAVDNVCSRLVDNGLDLMRLGSDGRIHPRLKHLSETSLTNRCKNVSELEDVYSSVKIVAVTTMGSLHPLLSRRTFDVCIVDESTQVLQCSLFRTLLASNRFVLIGDPDQLPPLVTNPEAVRRGMPVSLFEHLQSPEATVTLTHQYRMNETIMRLANDLTYDGLLECGNELVSEAKLQLQHENLVSKYDDQPWILQVLDPLKPVIGVDTGQTWKLKSQDTESDDKNCSNSYEAAVVFNLVEALKTGGVKSENIGVISPYTVQVSLIRKVLSDDNVEVNTVDQYQGRDKEVIVYSCTKSREASFKRNNDYNILEDKRRLTVAVTRAKHKFVIIGDFCTLKEYAPFARLLDCLRDEQRLQLCDSENGFLWKRVCEYVS